MLHPVCTAASVSACEKDKCRRAARKLKSLGARARNTKVTCKYFLGHNNFEPCDSIADTLFENESAHFDSDSYFCSETTGQESVLFPSVQKLFMALL
jgi:hypothetical protein